MTSLLLLLVAVLVPTCLSLECYSCGAGSREGDCEEFQEKMTSARDQPGDAMLHEYHRSCPDNYQSCVATVGRFEVN